MTRTQTTPPLQIDLVQEARSLVERILATPTYFQPDPDASHLIRAVRLLRDVLTAEEDDTETSAALGIMIGLLCADNGISRCQREHLLATLGSATVATRLVDARSS